MVRTTDHLEQAFFRDRHDELPAFVLDIADHFIDLPDFQGLVRAGLEERQQFIGGNWFFVPPKPVRTST